MFTCYVTTVDLHVRHMACNAESLHNGAVFQPLIDWLYQCCVCNITSSKLFSVFLLRLHKPSSSNQIHHGNTIVSASNATTIPWQCTHRQPKSQAPEVPGFLASPVFFFFLLFSSLFISHLPPPHHLSLSLSFLTPLAFLLPSSFPFDARQKGMPTVTTTVTSAAASGATTTVTTTEASPDGHSITGNAAILEGIIGEWIAGTLVANKARHFAPSCTVDWGTSWERERPPPNLTQFSFLHSASPG